MDKDILRKNALIQRNHLKNRADSSKVIKTSCLQSQEYASYRNIFLYASIGSEVDTREFIDEAFQTGKNVYLPRVDSISKTMEFYRFTGWSQCKLSKYRILEPRTYETCLEHDILMYVPGIAFDSFGYRLGYGGGYYDKYLAKTKKNIFTIMLAFEGQCIENIPHEDTDIPVNQIITEKEWRKSYDIK